MMKYINKQFQKGEISLTLSVLAIVVSVLGIALGSYSVQQNLTRSSQAQEGTFPYESTLELRDVNNNVVQFQNDMNWETTLLGETNSGKIKTAEGTLAQLIWLGPAPVQYRNQTAEVVVTLPEGYEAYEPFCEDREGTTCTEVSSSILNERYTISDIRLTDNAKITYGWKIRPIEDNSCPVNNEQCRITTLRVDSVVNDAVTFSWDRSSTCPGYSYGADQYWIDIVRPDNNAVVCAVATNQLRVTCRLGTPQLPGRLLDTSSVEYTSRAWVEGVQYSANIYHRDVSAACVSPPGSTSFRKDAPSPTQVPPSPTIVQPTDVNPSPTPIITQGGQCEVEGSNCRITGVKIDELSDHNVTIKWDNPRNCPGYDSSTDRFWIDVVRPGSPDSIVCSTDSGDNEATCTLGRAAPAGRQLDTNSEEFKNKKWQNNQNYIVNVYLRDTSGQCISQPGGKTFKYENGGGGNNGTGAERIEHIRGNGPFRVVFLPVGYSNDKNGYNTYSSDVKLAVAHFYANNLYSDSKNQMTFIQMNVMNEDFGCEVRDHSLPGVRYTRCNKDKAEQVIAEANGDRYALLLNGEQYRGTAPNASVGVGGVRVPSGAITYSFNHELGHSIASLQDEYAFWDDDGSIPTSDSEPYGYNCSSASDGGCNKWDNEEQCTPVCSYANYFRPSEGSAMNTNAPDTDFNTPSKDAWRSKLSAAEGVFLNNISDAIYNTSLTVTIRQNVLNNIEVSDVTVDKIYPDLSTKENFVGEYMTVRVLDDTNTRLFETIVPLEVFEPHVNPEPVLRADFKIRLPYFDTAQTIEFVSSTGSQLLTYDLQPLGLTAPSVEGNLCGNTVCDAQIGEDENSCPKDCGAHLTKSESERADLNGDGVVLANDLSILMDAYYTPGGDINGDENTNALDYQILIQYIGQETLSNKVLQLQSANGAVTE